jgi:APA family basic amino acid/polyamine antiporter
VPYVPALGIVVCGALMASLPGQTWLLALIWLAIGLVVYFTYSRRHSHLRGHRV